MRWLTRTRPRLHLGHSGPPLLGLPYVLTSREIHTHRHVMGLTGQGKSKLLASIFVQLHTQGVACALIDPHADLAHDVLASSTTGATSPTRTRIGASSTSTSAARTPSCPSTSSSQPYEDHAVALTIVEACKRAWAALADGAAPQFENILLHRAWS